ncbi:MAG: portal protein [Pseudomonadota bacterium]
MSPAPKAIGAENSSVAKMIFSRHEEMLTDRNARAPELEAVARLYRPQRQGFRSSSEKRDEYNLHALFNSTTLIAAGNMSSSLYSTLCSPANDWFQTTPPDPDLAEFPSVKRWNDIVSARMLRSFGPGISTFYASAVSWTADTVALGTGCLVSDEGFGRRRLIDSCISPADFVFACDVDGMADELITERWMTPVQAARFYGIDALPPKLRERAVQGKTDTRSRFLQAMQPNDSFTPGSFGAKGRPYLSTHISEDGMAVVRQGGMYEQNFAIPRWDVDGSNPWGHGMGYLTLASGQKLQAMSRDNLQAGAMMAKPPIGTTGTKALREGAKLAPGAFLHGAVSHTGQQLVRPILTGQGLPVTADMERMAKDEVENGWHAQLLTLVNRTGMGNLEVIERMEERLRLQAPFIGRMQTEGLSMVLERRFKMLFRAGQFPPPPRELGNQPLEIRFTSVAALAQKAGEGVATRRLLQDTYAMAAAQPTPEAQQEVWDNIDRDAAMAVLADSGGVPSRVVRSPEDREAIRQGRAQQKQMADAMAMAQQGAAAAKDMGAAMGSMAGMQQGAPV